MALDIRFGKQYPQGELSNFKRRPFVFRQQYIESMEGFLQGLKIQDCKNSNKCF